MLQLMGESKIKRKTVMSLSSAKEKGEHFFVPFILSEAIFLKICVLSQCIVYNFKICILLHIKNTSYTFVACF